MCPISSGLYRKLKGYVKFIQDAFFNGNLSPGTISNLYDKSDL